MTSSVLDPVEELAAIEQEFARRRHLADPVLWTQEKLGEQLWSKQAVIARSIANHRRTAVRSCHEIGKSFIAARAAGWWLNIHPVGQAFVVTSAPTATQVRAILWREIGRVHTRGSLPGRVNQTSWHMNTEGDKEEVVAMGRSPNDYDPTAFQGIHAPYVLVIFDEACGIGPPLWEAGDSLIANDFSKFLVIGNPDDPQTEFANICKPGSGWNVIGVSAFESPNFTGEPMDKLILQQLIGKTYVEEKRKKWAPNWYWNEEGTEVLMPEGAKLEDTNPYWQSKVLGQFPEHSEAGGLIPLSWIRNAQQRHVDPGDPNELGVDVGAGGDASAICHRRGGHFRIIREDRNPDTMQTCGNVTHSLEELEATEARVDEIGIGKGVVDRGKENGKPFVGINVGRKAFDPEHFINLRAELYWRVRERFESGDIDLDPLDEDTAAELVELRYKRLSSGKIQIESKDEMKRRGVPSPNRAEALMLANAFIPPKKKALVTW